MEWKLFKKITLLFLFIFSLSAQAAIYDIGSLGKKRVEYLIESNSIEKLKVFLESGITAPNIPTRIVERYKSERKTVLMYQQILAGGALEIRSLLKKKYTEYVNYAKKDINEVGFRVKYDEALYLHYLSRQLNDKSRDDEIDSFTYLLLFISNRLAFSYEKALKIHEALKDQTIKKKYSSILQKFIQTEYPETQDGNIPDTFKSLFN
jgi:hypothetical protein